MQRRGSYGSRELPQHEAHLPDDTGEEGAGFSGSVAWWISSGFVNHHSAIALVTCATRSVCKPWVSSGTRHLRSEGAEDSEMLAISAKCNGFEAGAATKKFKSFICVHLVIQLRLYIRMISE
jgi:hypothetical protein